MRGELVAVGAALASDYKANRSEIAQTCSIENKICTKPTGQSSLRHLVAQHELHHSQNGASSQRQQDNQRQQDSQRQQDEWCDEKKRQQQ